MFEYLRNKLGFGPKLTHDVHEHLKPQIAVALAKRLEPYRLFFPRRRAGTRADRLGTGSCASNAPRRRPWASYSPISTNTCR